MVKMQRPMIVGERIMYASGNVPVNCLFVVTVKGNIQEADLQVALHKLQSKHPLLRSLVDSSNAIPQFLVMDRAPSIPLIIKERKDEEQWIRESELQWKTPFDYQRAPLMRLLWIKGDTQSEFLIVVPHCISDGTSIINLMKELLQFIDQPDLPAVPYTMPADIFGLIGEKYRPQGFSKLKLKFFSGLASAYFSLVNGKKEIAKNTPYLVRKRIGVNDVTLLKQACKKHQVTIHTALSLATFQAFNKVKKQGANGKIICPVDIRAKVESIKDDMMFSFAPIINLELKPNTDFDFWPTAVLLQQQLKQKIDQIDPADQLASAESFHSVLPKMVQMLRVTNGSHDVTFSNVGIISIPNTYNRFEVVGAYAPSTALPWKNPNTLVAATFNGSMELSFYSAHEFLNQEEAISIMDEIKKAILDITLEEQVLKVKNTSESELMNAK